MSRAMGYLESHVLQEVGGTVVLGSLSAATGVDEHTDGGSLGGGVGLGRDGQTVLERGDAGARNLSGSSSGQGANGLR